MESFSELKMQIGNRVRELRKERKESQEAFAERCGIDRKYMSSIETGKANMSIFFIDLIITALGCGYEYFFSTEYFKTNPKR